MKKKLCFLMVICIMISATSIGFAAPIYDINEELETYSFEEIKKYAWL